MPAGRAHCGPLCGFLVLWLQIAIGTFALFHENFFDYTCFTMMLYRGGRGPYFLTAVVRASLGSHVGKPSSAYGWSGVFFPRFTGFRLPLMNDRLDIG